MGMQHYIIFVKHFNGVLRMNAPRFHTGDATMISSGEAIQQKVPQSKACACHIDNPCRSHTLYTSRKNELTSSV